MGSNKHLRMLYSWNMLEAVGQIACAGVSFFVCCLVSLFTKIKTCCAFSSINKCKKQCKTNDTSPVFTDRGYVSGK